MRNFLSITIVGLMLSHTHAKELFNQDDIIQYLGEENPFVYDTLGQKYVYEAKETYALGAFDTKISTKYDTKKYPVSEGDFFDTAIEKPMKNGLDLVARYRKAEGVQEYNNIKTGKQGEFQLGVKVPLREFIKGINSRKLNLQTASLDRIKFNFEAKNNLRFLYRDILSSYYKLLYYKALWELEKRLLSKGQDREYFIQRSVKEGALAEVSILEMEQQLINRQQRLLSATNDYENALENFLKYLSFSKELFTAQYQLMNILELPYAHTTIAYAIDYALMNRPDLQVLEYEKDRLALEMKQAQLLKYPKVDVGLYGVHDIQYDSGFKVALDMDFPIEQRRYKGKYRELQKKIDNIENKKEKSIIKLKTNLKNIINSLQIVQKNMENSKNEVSLVNQLEEAENKKYKLGKSNLFMVNQREVTTLEVKKKLLKYHLHALILAQEARNEMGKSFEIPNG